MISGVRNELGRLLAPRAGTGRRRVHYNLAGQQANTLLHDGHAWRGFARIVLAGARRSRREAQDRDAALLVHASFAFVRALPSRDPLRSLALAILEGESLALGGPVPACVVRLGWLYGPSSRDLLAYRAAFRLGRPYWSGPRNSRQDHLHQDDAAAALVAASRHGRASHIYYATDGHPRPFVQLMDAFAHRCGRRNPLHAPLLSKPVMKLIIREEHMQQAAHRVPARAPSPRVPHWKPEYPDYRVGLDAVFEAWNP